MKLDPTKLYMMPLIMGPQYEKDPLPRLPYPQTEVCAMRYQTDFEAASNLLHDCYNADQPPIVTVFFAYHRGLHFLAGGSYNFAAFMISASFRGQRDSLEGDYMPVVFENQSMPILGGREFLGVPKLYADIPPYKRMPNGNLRCEASLWGHLLFGIELPPMRKQNPAVKFIASRQLNGRPWFAYKYIPSLDGPPDADYPTITWNDVKLRDLWMTKRASLYFGTASEDDIAQTAHVIQALQELPIVKVEQVLRFDGSAFLRFDKSRRLS
jgi:acetoacetate decarboxylase